MTLAVNTELVDLAQLMIYTSMVVYALAFLALIAEWIFGSRSKVGRTAAALGSGAARRSAAKREADAEDAEPSEAATEDASGATEPAGAASKDAAEGAPRRPAVTVRAKAEGNAAGSGSEGTAGTGTEVLDRPRVVTRGSGSAHGDRAPDGPGAAGHDPQGDLYGRIAVALVVVAFLLHAGGVIGRAVGVGRAPWANMYEFSTAFSMVVVAGFLGLLAARRNVRWVALPMVTTVLLDLGLAVVVLDSGSDQLPPVLESIWLWIHVALAIVCGAMFYLGVVATVAFLFRDRYEAKLAAGHTPGRFASSVLERLPASVSLDRLAYRINAAVFPLWTFTIIAGAIWAEAAWGRYWGWDPKEVWSFITWVAYAAYLHARATAGWRGRKAAYLAIAGFLCYLFNYYGVNMFVDSLHSYAGV